MAIDYKDSTIALSGSIFENELVAINEYLKENNSNIVFDCTACKDIHGSVIQLIVSFKAIHGCGFIFSDTPTVYQKAIEGFRSVEDDCNK